MEKIIGVVSSVGPFAGVDLLRKILAQTVASNDQDHLTVLSVSRPCAIPDRTQYLLGQASLNPALAIAAQLCLLEQMGAQVAAIPCNTCHAPPIFDVMLSELRAAGSRLQVLHMLREVAQFINSYHPEVQRVGILATTGTCRTGIYLQALEPLGLEVLVPEPALQDELIHPAIYDPVYGLKAMGQATQIARNYILEGIEHLRRHGAEAIVLGCTELPLAIWENCIDEVIIIDSTLILARSLVREANSNKLKP
jgi:aspartate racemase